jgi:hypothetical protein
MQVVILIKSNMKMMDIVLMEILNCFKYKMKCPRNYKNFNNNNNKLMIFFKYQLMSIIIMIIIMMIIIILIIMIFKLFICLNTMNPNLKF